MKVFKIEVSTLVNLFKDVYELTKVPIDAKKFQPIELCVKHGIGKTSYGTKFLTKFLIEERFLVRIEPVNSEREVALLKWDTSVTPDFEFLANRYNSYVREKLQDNKGQSFTPVKNSVKKTVSTRILSIGTRVFVMYDNQIHEGLIRGAELSDNNDLEYSVRISIGDSYEKLELSCHSVFESLDELLRKLKLGYIKLK